MPGSLLRASIDTTHPLSVGVPSWVGVLKRNGRTLPYGNGAYVVARFDENSRMGGLASDRNVRKIAGTPFLMQQRLGGGAVIAFSDGCTTRGFTHSTKRLLLNAILYGPSL